MGKQWKQCQTLFLGAPKSLQMVIAAMKLKDVYSLGRTLQILNAQEDNAGRYACVATNEAGDEAMGDVSTWLNAGGRFMTRMEADNLGVQLRKRCTRNLVCLACIASCVCKIDFLLF